MSSTLPKRRGASGARRPSSSTPQQQRNVSTTNRILSTRILSDSSGLIDDPIHFHQNKHTILSNFEEWIKMATDNKITVKNSWNFGLIDYFADLNVIKDGENINFQRASATLDGCVKIYSSRVESAASETGKLLSGLAKKKEHEEQSETEEDAEGEGEEGEDGEGDEEPKKKRKMNRIVESTLVDFDTIKIKKLEQELAIDPLFKKALAEFDEGGAKSLLLNSLNIDNNGRVVFDATTNPDAETTEQVETIVNDDIDMKSLSKIVLRDSGLDDLTLVPSLAEFQSALEDVESAKTILTDLSSKNNETNHYPTPAESNEYDFFDDDMNDFNADDGDLGPPPEVETPAQANNTTDPYNLTQTLLPRLFEEEPRYEKQQEEVLDRDLMAYFDDRMRHNWRGPEHWKVTAFKRANNIDQESKPKADTQQTTHEKKKHDAVVVDFFGDDVDEDTLFEAPRNPSTLVKKENSGLNKLPDDIRYTSSRLITLFTKQFTISTYSVKPQATLTDAQFFGDAYKEQEERERLEKSFREAELADDDGFIENDFGGIDFNDALESTKVEEKTTDQGIMGKRSGEYVSFSRVAKRVNVRLLKDNMWGAIKQETDVITEEPQESEDATTEEVKPVKFGQIVSKISTMYKPEQAKDISTSFCFICLLHLANEHGLEIQSIEGGNDLEIKGNQMASEQGTIEAF
ncbi:uncharacterized protein SPAPADRAFT_131586 [Spathaspora passalidarum NRRL Y-27907]|uniref:Condensin complex subunit 2 n=1 Tax=Spathaspora passalidarum (strain NRRL Y-27907 / 11-Y1) TaxID=619300 RepID=G3AEE0_SPAPN|nr:uncharacterized protein SPAPADRAFT_131586 [Spathaspora passalidarum NRRL Y-27907]EGW35728.1 hypothetical protein SPAPADRAFT_131586 [Spathaspora passalidarum NRRL Y-27907]